MNWRKFLRKEKKNAAKIAAKIAFALAIGGKI